MKISEKDSENYCGNALMKCGRKEVADLLSQKVFQMKFADKLDRSGRDE